MWPSSIGRILRPVTPRSCETFLSRGSRVVTPAVRPEPWQAGAPPDILWTPLPCLRPFFSHPVGTASACSSRRPGTFVGERAHPLSINRLVSTYPRRNLLVAKRSATSPRETRFFNIGRASARSCRAADTPRRLFRRLPPGAARQQNLFVLPTFAWHRVRLPAGPPGLVRTTTDSLTFTLSVWRFVGFGSGLGQDNDPGSAPYYNFGQNGQVLVVSPKARSMAISVRSIRD